MKLLVLILSLHCTKNFSLDNQQAKKDLSSINCLRNTSGSSNFEVLLKCNAAHEVQSDDVIFFHV